MSIYCPTKIEIINAYRKQIERYQRDIKDLEATIKRIEGQKELHEVYGNLL